MLITQRGVAENVCKEGQSLTQGNLKFTCQNNVLKVVGNVSFILVYQHFVL